MASKILEIPETYAKITDGSKWNEYIEITALTNIRHFLELYYKFWTAQSYST